jgi:hypothetical protein
MALLVLDQIEVIKHQHRRPAQGSQLVDQQRQHIIDQARAGSPQRRQRLLAHGWV